MSSSVRSVNDDSRLAGGLIDQQQPARSSLTRPLDVAICDGHGPRREGSFETVRCRFDTYSVRSSLSERGHGVVNCDAVTYAKRWVGGDEGVWSAGWLCEGGLER